MKRTITFLLLLLFIYPISGMAADTPQGMFELYDLNRKNGTPNYITEDFLFLSYCMILDDTITDLESRVLYPSFINLNAALIKKMAAEKSQDKAQQAVLDYLSVLEYLLSGEKETSGAANPKQVADEVRLVLEAKGIVQSVLMKQPIDYSQFKVRGKYTQSEELGRYFRAMRYAGIVLFPALESKATGITPENADFLTAQALILADAVNKDSQLTELYSQLTRDLSWLFGPPDDLTIDDYLQVRKKEPEAPINKFRAALMDYARENGKQPSIIAGTVDAAALEKEKSAKDVMTGFRFMPQRMTPDSAAFQQLVYNQVTEYQGKGKKKPFTSALIHGKVVKAYPMGIELMALMGSEEAMNRLKSGDDTNYQGYQKASEAAAKILRQSEGGLPAEQLRLIRYWLNRGKQLQEKAEEKRRLETCLSFWTYYRYMNVLYAKQSTSMVGKSISIPPPRDTAWLEPVPELYLLMKKQVNRIVARFSEAEKSDTFIGNLTAFTKILDTCHDISLAEINNRPLKSEQIAFLNDLDATLLDLVGDKDQPIVVDVHSVPSNGTVLQEAIGYPRVTRKKLNGKNAVGALFHYYEFKYDMKNRLTDNAWQTVLKSPGQLKALAFSPGCLP